MHKPITRVLYIDDDPYCLNSVERALSRRGYSFIGAATGKIGMALAEHERPDIILLDILLPDTTGFEIAEQLSLHPLLRHATLIALTASIIDSDREAALNSNFDGYLTKPIIPAELYQMLERIRTAVA